MDKFYYFQKLTAILSKLNSLKKWQLMLYIFIIAEIMTFALNYSQSLIWWGHVNQDLLLIGTIDAAVIVLILGPLLIYSITLMTKFEEYRKSSIEQSLAERKYRHYIENSLDIVTVVDKNGFIKYESPSVEKVLGYNPGELIGRSVFDFLHPDEREYIINLFVQKVSEYNSSATAEMKMLKRNGTWIDLSVSGRNLLHDDIVDGIVLNSRDITDFKETHIKLSRLLEEKKTLIREIHHRVKNNFQSISSMLYLQASMIEDDNLKEVLNVSRNRVHSLAILHDNLQLAEDVSAVNLLTYFSRLTDSIVKSYLSGKQNIKIEVNIDSSYELDTDQSILLGLIFNELISNIFKHAFPGGREGVVKIHFSRSGGTNLFSVRDNGIGLPENFDVDKSSSLGLKIVKTFSTQLEGEFSFSNNNGMEFLLKFPQRANR